MSYRSHARRSRKREAARRRMSREHDPAFVVDRTLTWHILVAGPNQEHEVGRALARLGVEAFLPGYTERVTRRGKLVPMRRLYLGRYVVFGVPEGRGGLADIEAIRGVSSISRWADGRPMVIRHAEMEAIAGRLTGDDVERTTGIRKALLMLGQAVQVMEGPFAGFSGSVDALRETGRVRVVVDLFGRPTPVELAPDHVKAA